MNRSLATIMMGAAFAAAPFTPAYAIIVPAFDVTATNNLASCPGQVIAQLMSDDLRFVVIANGGPATYFDAFSGACDIYYN